MPYPRPIGDDRTLVTCPQYLAATPFVSSVAGYLVDYKRGALGDVRELPAVLYEALGILEDESARLDNFLTERVHAVYGH